MATSANAPKTYSCRVLYVDDLTEDQRLLSEAVDLAEVPVELVCATSGEKALDILKADCEFDFVLLDWNLPRVSGDELLDDLRAKHPGIPILVLTGEPATVSLTRPSTSETPRVIRKPPTLEAWEDFARMLVDLCAQPIETA
jgi:CheY-like chemotaxis protein